MAMETTSATTEPAAAAIPAGTEAMKMPIRMMTPLISLPSRKTWPMLRKKMQRRGILARAG